VVLLGYPHDRVGGGSRMAAKRKSLGCSKLRPLSLVLIHPSAWNMNSPKFRCRIVHISPLRGARMASKALHAAWWKSTCGVGWICAETNIMAPSSLVLCTRCSRAYGVYIRRGLPGRMRRTAARMGPYPSRPGWSNSTISGPRLPSSTIPCACSKLRWRAKIWVTYPTSIRSRGGAPVFVTRTT
jgi:hypothetical protein